jgi:3-oxoacyl-[acyl-carrier protein] reductase
MRPAAAREGGGGAGEKPLRGRTALVTGVSRRSGIGFAVARRLGELGADLYLQGWREHDAGQPWGEDPVGSGEMVRALQEETGVRVEYSEVDLGSPEAPATRRSGARQAYGHLDVLVANHARSSSGGSGSLGSLTAREIDAHLAVNVRATMLLVQAFALGHDGRPGGRVVLFTSGQHLGPMPGELDYATSKGAVHQMTLPFAADLIRRGITLNTVNPGPVDTGYLTQEEREEIAAQRPHWRWGEPGDAARLVGWLCTDEAAWVVGQVIDSEGGFRL